MSLQKFNPRNLILFLFILATGIIRVALKMNYDLAPLSNFSPLGAMALFGGAYFSKSWKALGFPLATLFISDVILSLTVYSQHRTGLLYGEWMWTYGAFALMVLVGKWVIKKVTINRVFIAALSCVFIHWIVTDFGVWLGSTFYPQTFAGYIACLIAALPFEGNFLAGTLIYSAVLFGAFEWMQQKYTVLKPAIPH